MTCSLPESITAAMPLLADTADVPVGGYTNAFMGIPENWNEKTDPDPERRDEPAARAHAKFCPPVVGRWRPDRGRLLQNLARARRRTPKRRRRSDRSGRWGGHAVRAAMYWEERTLGLLSGRLRG